ncbi:hypothetical protein GCM10007932_25280 [Vibrio penaeicida]|uniref:Uncharacterized protein n=1 Tax=Vibrio penaeicida TaxID=104609 RepID=A0AAV5NRP4_9VIBR|nr:hypothetical protein GCM10007932_25280 [Vibrio penaeicida]
MVRTNSKRRMTYQSVEYIYQDYICQSNQNVLGHLVHSFFFQLLKAPASPITKTKLNQSAREIAISIMLWDKSLENTR